MPEEVAWALVEFSPGAGGGGGGGENGGGGGGGAAAAAANGNNNNNSAPDAFGHHRHHRPDKVLALRSDHGLPVRREDKKRGRLLPGAADAGDLVRGRDRRAELELHPPGR